MFVDFSCIKQVKQILIFVVTTEASFHPQERGKGLRTIVFESIGNLLIVMHTWVGGGGAGLTGVYMCVCDYM